MKVNKTARTGLANHILFTTSAGMLNLNQMNRQYPGHTLEA
jgi:hypothetical protein